MKSLMVTKLLTAITMNSMLAVCSVDNPAPAIDTAGGEAKKLNEKHCNSSRDSTQWMWGDADPNIYYICDESSNATRQLHCPAGRGFFNGRGHYGCIPYEEWPACLDGNSNSGNNSNNAVTADLCTDDRHLQETWTAVDPNKFHICQQANTTPLLLNCEPGRGYVSAWLGGADGDEGTGGGGGSGHERIHIVGCATWEKWRMYMHCEDFY